MIPVFTSITLYARSAVLATRTARPKRSIFDTAFLHFLAGIVSKLTSKDLSKATGIMMPRGATLPPCRVSASTLYTGDDIDCNTCPLWEWQE